MSNAVITQPTTLPAWMSGIAGALPDAIASAKTIIEAGFAPKDCKGPQSIVVAVAMGARLGLDPFTAIYGIAVVNGRPSLYGDALLAVCMNHSQWEDFSETWEGKKYEGNFTAICTVKRKGRDPFTVDFCVDDAVQAGLWKKAGPWTTTPMRMLMMRARAFALRGAFADALAGFHSREEMEDSPLIDVTASSSVQDEPKPGRVRLAKEDVKPSVKPAPAAVATNDDNDPVVILDETSAIEPKKTNLEFAQAIDAAAVTVDAIWKRCLQLSQTKSPVGAGACLQTVIKETSAKWGIKTVSDLGGETDLARKQYLVELETRVAAWSAQFANGVEV